MWSFQHVCGSPDNLTLADKTVGDVAVGEDGRMYAVTLGNSGQTCWTCIEGGTMDVPSIILALLKTIKWSAHYQHQHAGVLQRPATAVPKRRKTAYNQHIGRVLRHLAATRSDMPRKQRMRLAVDSWKARGGPDWPPELAGMDDAAAAAAGSVQQAPWEPES